MKVGRAPRPGEKVTLRVRSQIPEESLFVLLMINLGWTLRSGLRYLGQTP